MQMSALGVAMLSRGRTRRLKLSDHMGTAALRLENADCADHRVLRLPDHRKGDKTCEIAASDCNAVAFFATLDTEKAGLTSLLYSTYLRGDGADFAKGIALEAW